MDTPAFLDALDQALAVGELLAACNGERFLYPRFQQKNQEVSAVA
ncbi:hypothetical protein [Xanthomonas nasturtii]|nr:hypothetical protein [Xanthomonas nasturtii]